jgi:esterase
MPHIAAFDLAHLGQQPGRFPHKTLFLNGGKSKFLRSTHLPTIAKLFPTFALATVREAGHWIFHEAPEETLSIVQRYLDEEIPH